MRWFVVIVAPTGTCVWKRFADKRDAERYAIARRPDFPTCKIGVGNGPIATLLSAQ